MKKHLIYTGMFLAAIGFSACNEDFKDWADPQSNPQEESAGQLTATFTAGKDASIVMDAATAQLKLLLFDAVQCLVCCGIGGVD